MSGKGKKKNTTDAQVDERCMHAESLQLCWTLCDPWAIPCQAPLSMGFSRQEDWSRLPFSPPGEEMEMDGNLQCNDFTLHY